MSADPGSRGRNGAGVGPAAVGTGEDGKAGTLTSKTGHPWAKLVETKMHGDVRQAFGSDDRGLVDLLANQLVYALPGNQIENAIDLMRAIAPRDGVEGLLAAQMAACHALAMHAARQAAVTNASYKIVASYAALSGGFMRTFAAQLEALNRGRGKATTQRFVVERVTVEAGGQAVVGTVAAPGGRGS